MRLILFFLIMLPGLSFAQANFTEHLLDTTDAARDIKNIITADFDNDTWIDIATVHGFSNEIAIYYNNSGMGFHPRQIAGITPEMPTDIASGDFNNDGWQDLASLSFIGNALAWYPNQNGNFGQAIVIDSNHFFPVNIIAGDFTNDSIDDLIWVDDTVVKLYHNDGQGNFTASTIAGQTEFYSASVADLNGDNHPDLLLGSVLLYTYINNGDGTFTRDTRNESLINNFIFEIETADIDSDGDQDMAVYYSNTNPNIDWYANDGTGRFTTGGTITDSSNDVKKMTLADLNMDNHPDFVTGYGQTGELVWMQNNGQGNFSSEVVLKNYPHFPRQVETTDFDRDGDEDIFLGHHSDGLFLWENLTIINSVEEHSASFNLYPNPAQDYINIEMHSYARADIFNVQGQLILSRDIIPGNNYLRFNLKPGVYIIRISNDNQLQSKRLIIR